VEAGVGPFSDPDVIAAWADTVALRKPASGLGMGTMGTVTAMGAGASKQRLCAGLWFF